MVILHVTEDLLEKFPYVVGDICDVKPSNSISPFFTDKTLNSITSTKPGNNENHVYYNDRVEILILDDSDIYAIPSQNNPYNTIAIGLGKSISIKKTCSNMGLRETVVAIYCDMDGKPLEHELAKLLIETKDV